MTKKLRKDSKTMRIKDVNFWRGRITTELSKPEDSGCCEASGSEGGIYLPGIGFGAVCSYLGMCAVFGFLLFYLLFIFLKPYNSLSVFDLSNYS